MTMYGGHPNEFILEDYYDPRPPSMGPEGYFDPTTPASPASPFSNAADYNPWGAGRPAWLPEYMPTQEESLQRFTARMQPFWTTRAPMAELGSRLGARYLLDAPHMAAGQPTSFYQYLQDYAGGGVPSYMADPAELRSRAERAARFATTPAGVQEELTAEEFGGLSPEAKRDYWYGEMFGPGASNAGANQIAVANLLALQRPGGDAYQGQMAQAIRNAVSRMYNLREATGKPREGFLSWYLGQSQQPTRQPGQQPGPSQGGPASYFDPAQQSVMLPRTTDQWGPKSYFDPGQPVVVPPVVVPPPKQRQWGPESFFE